MGNRNLQGPQVSVFHCTMIFLDWLNYVFDVYHVYGIKAELGIKIDSENEEIVLNGSHFAEACNCYLCLSSEF